jgi:drug/metabolite transporter (DMT)-like permease
VVDAERRLPYDGPRSLPPMGQLGWERFVLWFGLSVGSALFQVLRNMVMKRLGHALDETINVWGRFTFILPFAAIGLLVEGVPVRQPGVYTYCLLFAVAQIAGTQCLALALKVAEISLVTALWKLSVVLLVVWGYLALGEEPSRLGVAGVLVSVAGVYLINVSRARLSLWAPLVALVRDPGQRYTLGAALSYAPAVILIKKIALLSNPAFAVFMGYLFCSLLITPWVLYRSARHFRQLGRHWLGFVGLGAFAALSTQLGTTAYTLTVTSYVEAVKQVEILLALVIGWLAFGEGARIRQIWLGCVVMLAGIVLLILGKG